MGWLHGPSNASTTSTFRVAPRNNVDWAPRLVLFGDLGYTDNQILPYLAEECQAGAVDAVILFGDMVYWDDGENENSFMRDLSAMTGQGAVPIMVRREHLAFRCNLFAHCEPSIRSPCACHHDSGDELALNKLLLSQTSPGNGDYSAGTYARYKLQFAMPGWETQAASTYHSFDIGAAHIVGINTEVIEWGVPNPSLKASMLAWLEADLTAANAPAARAKRPWIIVHFHRPAYTTGNSDSLPRIEFEPYLFQYGVDVVFAGHVHNQERTLPVFNDTVMSGEDDPDQP